MIFTERIKNLFNLSDESIHLLSENMEEIAYNKGDIITREGQRDTYIYFVEKGLTHSYVLRDGKHRSLLFAFDGDAAVLTLDFYSNKISKITIEAMEDTLLFRISRERLDNLFSTSLELANWGRKWAEKNLAEYEQFFVDYYWADKGTQYYSLIKNYPQLMEKVSLKELASYLNITPQSLSRIRARRKD